MTLENKIANLITPALESLDLDLIKVIMTSNGVNNILQIMVERADGASVDISDCEKASRQISALLDVEDLVSEKYVLEVGSPGIDRPLTRLKDFEKYKELEAKVEVLEKIDGQRKFRGRIKGLDGDNIIIKANIVSLEKPQEDAEVKIEFNNIKNAKLILNDELLNMNKTNNI